MNDFIALAKENIDHFDFNKVRMMDDNLPEMESLNLTVEGFNYHKYDELIVELKKIQNNQYYFLPEKLHMTLLPYIKPEFFEPAEAEKIGEIINQYSINFEVLCADFSNYATMQILNKPLFDLADLRQKLRDAINPKREEWNLYTNGFEEIGHINVLRYLEMPKIELFNRAYELVDKSFGPISPKSLRVVKLTSRVLADGKYQVIKTIEINSRR